MNESCSLVGEISRFNLWSALGPKGGNVSRMFFFLFPISKVFFSLAKKWLWTIFGSFTYWYKKVSDENGMDDDQGWWGMSPYKKSTGVISEPRKNPQESLGVVGPQLHKRHDVLSKIVTTINDEKQTCWTCRLWHKQRSNTDTNVHIRIYIYYTYIYTYWYRQLVWGLAVPWSACFWVWDLKKLVWATACQTTTHEIICSVVVAENANMFFVAFPFWLPVFLWMFPLLLDHFFVGTPLILIPLSLGINFSHHFCQFLSQLKTHSLAFLLFSALLFFCWKPPSF